MNTSGGRRQKTGDPTFSTDEWEKQLGEAIRGLRIQQKITQQELAKLANISLTGLRNLETGRGSTLRSFILVIRALEQTNWLQELTPQVRPISPMELLRERKENKRTGTRIRVRK